MNIRKTALAALSFVIVYNILFFHTKLGLGTGILFLLLNVYFYFNKSSESKNLNLALLSSAVSIFFAFLFAFRDNDIVQIVNLLGAGIFSLVALYFYKFSGYFSFQIPGFLLIPLIAAENFIGSLFSIFKGESWSSEGLKNDSTSSLIRGLIIAVPIFAVLLILLTNADPIFGKLTQNLFSNIGERVIVSLVIFMIMFGFGLTKFFPKHSDEKEEESDISGGKSHELAIICGSLVGLFGVFIFIQFRYLFLGVGERELHQLGIASLTYSEYVRKGFFELLIASTIASGVIIYVLKYLHHLKDKQKALVQIFSAFLTIETGLLLLSAAKRVFLYADAHGLTRARIFGFIFLVWLAVILTIFLIKIFKEMKKEWFFSSALFTTLLALLSINLINVDGLIAAKYRPTVNEEIDYYYITSLSTDAKDSWRNAILDSERIVSQLETHEQIAPEDNRKLYWTRSTIDQLYRQIGRLISKYGTIKEIQNWHVNELVGIGTINEQLRNAKSEDDLPNLQAERKWQSINLTEYKTYRMVMEDINFYEQISSLQNRMSKLDSKITDQVRSETRLDRATQPPLTP